MRLVKVMVVCAVVQLCSAKLREIVANEEELFNTYMASCENCNSQKCPSWSPWSKFSSYSLSCNGGKMSRSRIRTSWSNWEEYSDKSKSCGLGSKTRQRICLNGKIGDVGCQGISTDAPKICNRLACLSWSTWSQFVDCSVSCGNGTQTRSRVCQNGSAGDKGCYECGVVDGESRNPQQDCASWSNWAEYASWSNWAEYTSWSNWAEYTSWSNWAEYASWSNWAEYASWSNWAEYASWSNWAEYVSWSNWGEYGDGSLTRDRGLKVRSRSCRNGDISQGGCAKENNLDSETCNDRACPSWSAWSQFGDCSVSFGNRTKTRSRVCQNGSEGDKRCHKGRVVDTKSCNPQDCSAWSSWTEYSECLLTSGNDSKTKTTTCENDEVGMIGCHQVETTVSNKCNPQACPVRSSWSEYNECSVSCGNGTHIRTRTYDNGDIRCHVGGTTTQMSLNDDNLSGQPNALQRTIGFSYTDSLSISTMHSLTVGLLIFVESGFGVGKALGNAL